MSYVAPDRVVKIIDQGKHCITTKPGDLILVEHSGYVPAVIRLGQRIFYWRKRLFGHAEFDSAYCQANHAAIVVKGGRNAQIIGMGATGGEQESLVTYKAKKYAVVSLHSLEDQRATTIASAHHALEIDYGYLSIAAITVNVLIGWNIVLGTSSLICSAMASLALRCQGFIPDGADPVITPADLARMFEVRL